MLEWKLNKKFLPLFYTIMVSILSFALVMTALDIKHGEKIILPSRQPGLGQLLVPLAEKLGVIGSIIIGTIATLGCLLWFINEIRKSKAGKIIP